MGNFDIWETRDYWRDKVVSWKSVASGWVLFASVVVLTQVWQSGTDPASALHTLASLRPPGL